MFSAVTAFSLLATGCSAESFDIKSESEIETESESDIETLIFSSTYPLMDFKRINQVLEEKNYPYRIKFRTTLVPGKYWDMSAAEQSDITDEALKHCDLAGSAAIDSFNKVWYREGLLDVLDDQLLSLLPSDMYRTTDGENVVFPANFFNIRYQPGSADLYYAIVKEDLAEEYAIETLDDLEQYMMNHDDYTVANRVQQKFDLKNKSEPEYHSWMLGIHWDDEKEFFYNPYTAETDHLNLAAHIMNHVKEKSLEEDTDIIFYTQLRDGYRGIEYQPYVLNYLTCTGVVFPINGSKYAQQFVYDLYTDPDLSNAAVVDRDEDVVYGNLELISSDVLKERYGIESFSYKEFVDSIASKESKIFDLEMNLVDVCTREQLLELMEWGSFNSLGVFDGTDERLEKSISSQPEFLDEIIEKMNALYQEKKSKN